jgi:hypothetical protein
MINRGDSTEDGAERYYEVDFAPGDAFSFDRPTDAALDGLTELLRRLPVRPFVGDSFGQDSLNNASMLGSVEQVMLALRLALAVDYEENSQVLADTCEFKTFVVEFNARPDALHIVTQISPKDGSERGILYGSRVQHIADDVYALWSHHG